MNMAKQQQKNYQNTPKEIMNNCLSNSCYCIYGIILMKSGYNLYNY